MEITLEEAKKKAQAHLATAQGMLDGRPSPFAFFQAQLHIGRGLAVMEFFSDPSRYTVYAELRVLSTEMFEKAHDLIWWHDD